MSDVILHSVTGLLIFCLGLRALLIYQELVRKVLALNFMGTGILMFIMAMAMRVPGHAPDPVPHAIVLTSIVVAVCATALLLVLAGNLHALTGSTRLGEDETNAEEGK
jgi:multicomponent Na+:H+ antiporter subunit C